MRVKEVCELINGRAFKPTDWGIEGVPIIRIQNLNDENAPFNYFSGEYSQIHEINNGELLFSWSGTPGTSFGAFRWNRGKGVLNQHIFKVIPKVDVDKDYLKYALNGNLQAIIEKAHGGVGLQHITKKELDEIEIPIPNKTEQKEIVNCLQETEKIVGYRKRQLQALDSLIKARFVEMFGDPVENSMGWKQTILKVVCKKITDGEHGTVPRESVGHPFLNAKHINQNGSIDWQNVTYISDEIHKRIYKRCNPEPGDILMTTTGTIGNVAITPVTEEFSMDRGITLLKLDQAIVLPHFIAWLLRFDGMQMIMTANIHASAIGHLFLNKVEQLPVIVPPIQLQEQFASFASQIDKSKAAVQKALNESQLLFDSLMQKYFD